MKYFVYLCEDISDSERAARIRESFLSAHLAYVEENLEAYAVAGPNRHPDSAYHSSTFILKADDLAGADQLMAGDPYVEAGLYRGLSGVEFVPAAGDWVGGRLWCRTAR